ncbi:MAG: hypothetical protein P8K82_09970, partial [Paracoccaceae bacterium]|nr:hypothetical protein [Paracoccaceae bacterium]
MLEFNNVSKSFWTGTQRKVILDRVSFRVELGTSLGILAPNGTGVNAGPKLHRTPERKCTIWLDLAIENHFIPRGVAHYAISHSAKTQTVVFLLVPKFSMAAFSAAIETLRIANQLTGQPLYQWSIISEDGAAVSASNGVSVGVDGQMEGTERDAVIFVCSGVEPHKMTSAKSANWIREQWRRGQTVGGLCTGAYTL